MKHLGSVRFHRVLHLVSSTLVADLVLVLGACDQRRADRKDCAEILDRIVEIELHERAFRDEALLRRKKEQLRQRFATNIAACEGRPLPAGAMACVHRAETTEELSHECLR